MRKSIISIRDPLRWKQNVYNQNVEVVSLLAHEMLSFHCQKVASARGSVSCREKYAME